MLELLKKNEQQLVAKNNDLLEANKKLKGLNALLTKTKEQVEKSEEKLQLLIKNSNDIFVLVNEKGEQYFISDAVEKLTGYSSEELNGPIKNVIYPDDIPIVKDHWDRVINNKNKADRIEYRHIHKEKGYIWLEAIAQNFLEHKAINSVVANIRDITERKKIEKELKTSEEIREKLNKIEKNRMLNSLINSKKRLASTTLRSIQNAERDAEMIKQLEAIKEHTDSDGLKIINSLISNSKRTSLSANWREFEAVFEEIQPSFYKSLNDRFPTLTSNEIKICAFLKLKMSNIYYSPFTRPLSSFS